MVSSIFSNNPYFSMHHVVRPIENSLPLLNSQRVVKARNITQEVKAIVENENKKTVRVKLDYATKLSTESINIVEFYLYDIPQAPRKPGAKVEQPLSVTKLPTSVKIHLIANSIFL